MRGCCDSMATIPQAAKGNPAAIARGGGSVIGKAQSWVSDERGANEMVGVYEG